jgi:hypothetical protein
MTGYTALYNPTDIVNVAIDFLTSIFVGMNTQTLVLGSILILTVILVLLSKAIRHAFGVVLEFLGFAKKMEKH